MAQERTVISPQEGEELKRLYAALPAATAKANAALRASGMTSEAFREADAEVSVIIRGIKKILGVDGKHWMAI